MTLLICEVHSGWPQEPQYEEVKSRTSNESDLRIADLLEAAREAEQRVKRDFDYACVTDVSVRLHWMLLPTEEEKLEIESYEQGDRRTKSEHRDEGLECKRS